MLSANQYSPQVLPVRRSQVLMWSGAVLFALVWMSLIVGAPFALAHGYSELAQVIYKAFSPLCHQIADRSFHLEGHAFAVCSRCTGIYAGVAAGVMLYPLMRSLKRTDTPARMWLLLSAVPILIDWSLGFFGLWANNHLSRFLTGGLLGFVAALYIVPGLMDVLQTDWRQFFKGSAKESATHARTTVPVAPERVVPSDYSSPSSRI
jgi:Predicted membrane protein